MNGTVMDPAKLAAFADGALEPEEAAEVVLHLADHPQDQAYVDQLMALNEMLGAAYSAPMDQPAPEAILTAIDPGRAAPNVTPFRARAPKRRMAIWGGAGAIAAGLAAFAILAPWSGGPFLSPGVLDQRSVVAEALDEMSTGDIRFVADRVEMRVISSFAAKSRGVCREFELIHQNGAIHDHGVACPTPGADGWTVEVVEAINFDEPNPSFTLASGEGEDAVTAFIDQIDGGLALTPDEEASARAANWRP